MHFASKRKEYSDTPFSSQDLLDKPFELIKKWIDDALQLDLPEPNAAILATASTSAQPSCRTILIKEVSEAGLCFFTNYTSRKSQELETNAQAALTMLWLPLTRQIVIEGQVIKLTEQENDNYWCTRPRGSQLGALTSQQGKIIQTRKELEERYLMLDNQYQNQEIPRPSFWGGFRLYPHRVEFWKGRKNRIHDRWEYQKKNTSWITQRLSP